MTRDVERYFSTHAASFDRLYELAPHERLLNRIFRRAVYQRFALTFEHAGDVRGKRILDVGCGSGRYAVEFARRGAEVVGIDVAPAMLELAQALAHRASVADRCRFERADLMTFANPSPFDVSIAIGVFDYIADPAAFFARICALTRGRVMATFPAQTWPRSPLRRLRYAVHGLPVYFYRPDGIEAIVAVARVQAHRVIPLSAGYFLIADTEPR